MSPYFLLLIIPFFFSLYPNKAKEEKSKYAIYSFFCILILLLSLRKKTVGIDLVNYEFLFDYITSSNLQRVLNLVVAYEPGYVIYNYICGLVSKDFQIMLTITALLSIVPLFFLYRKKMCIPMLTIALFLSMNFFRFYFSGIRQGLALAFVVPAFYFCRKANLKYFLAVVVGAMMIHHASLIMIFMYPLYKYKISKNKLPIIAFILLLVFVLRTILFSALVPLLGDKFEETYGEIAETNAFGMAFFFLLLMLMSFILSDEKQMDNDDFAMRNYLVMSVGLQIFASVSTIAMRIGYFYFMFIPIIIPIIISKTQPENRIIAKIAKYVLVACLLLNYTRIVLKGGDLLQIYPYVPYWEN